MHGESSFFLLSLMLPSGGFLISICCASQQVGSLLCSKPLLHLLSYSHFISSTESFPSPLCVLETTHGFLLFCLLFRLYTPIESFIITSVELQERRQMYAQPAIQIQKLLNHILPVRI